MEQQQGDPEKRRQLARALAARNLAPEGCRLEWLAADGSQRGFARIRPPLGPSLVAVLPGPPGATAEALAAWRIGRHLAKAGVPVPEVVGLDRESHILFLEDLGDRSLYQLLQERALQQEDQEEWYRRAIEALLTFQLVGRQGFVPDWCWETRRYDRALMLARESGYFHQALCRDLLGFPAAEPGLLAEFEALADAVADQPADWLLHRDFQCRNLMVYRNRIRIIDFQGARLGPLAYDLASLLIDPYAGLASAARQRLLAYYLDLAGQEIALDRQRFLEGYYHMALQRNLQILGAFAFLSHRRGKSFFRAFLAPAARALARRLAARPGRFPRLTDLARQVADRLSQGQFRSQEHG